MTMTLNINSKSISNVSNPFSDQNQKDKDFENLWKSFKIITSKSAFEIVYVWHNEDSKYQFKIHFKYFKSILRSKSKVHLKLCMFGIMGTVNINSKSISNISNPFSDQNQKCI